MIRYLASRVVTMGLTLALVSTLIFFIINLPPGDFLSNQIAELQAQGEAASVAKAEFLRAQYSLDEPLWKQYLIWLGAVPGPDGYSGLLQGDWGWSFEFDQPVSDVLGETIWLTVLVNLAAMLFIYAVSLPLGTLAADHARQIGLQLRPSAGFDSRAFYLGHCDRLRDRGL